jgi:hypothetical protein
MGIAMKIRAIAARQAGSNPEDQVGFILTLYFFQQ